MVIQLSKLGKRLQGKLSGRKDCALICNMVASAKPGEVLYLDFKDIESVNGSWLNMAVAVLFRWAAEVQHDFFPVIANFPAKDVDELELVAMVNQQCYPLVSKVGEPIQTLRLVGQLEPQLQSTLERVIALREATGAQLASEASNSSIGPTAWNNRLAMLHDKRLIHRRKEGRQQIYSPIAEEMVFHG